MGKVESGGKMKKSIKNSNISKTARYQEGNFKLREATATNKKVESDDKPYRVLSGIEKPTIDN